MKKTLMVLVGLSLAAACGDGQQAGGQLPIETPHFQKVKSSVSLAPFGSCAEFEDYVHDTAAKEMRSQYSYYGYGMRGGMLGGPPMAAEDNASAAPTAGGTSTQKSPDYSNTNVQVAGVDEADFVKTDGYRTFYIQGRRLFVLKTWPAEESGILSTTDIEGYPQEMFLKGTKLVVFSGIPTWSFDPSVPNPDATSGARPADDIYYPYYWSDGTKVSVYDVSTDSPALSAAFYLGGSYASSRRVDDQVRIVLRGEPRWPALKYAYNYGGYWGGDYSTWLHSSDVQKVQDENEATIRARPLSDWLPRSFKLVGTQKVELPVDCTSFHHGSGDSRLGFATVMTLDLATLTDVRSTTVVSEVGQIYSSMDNLYVTSPHYWWNPSDDEGQYTYVHKFDVSQKTNIGYKASGVFPGYVLDQFSMGEHNGYLRVAASNQHWDRNTGASSNDNRVYVLGEDAATGGLTIVGKTDNLAPDERIYSSRFEGDKGFVVTYRQVDPLFTLDLSDPKNPKVMGALKIPGFSTYIHMLDANHLLTIGTDTSTVNGTTRNGVGLQIFDVTDLANPKLTAKEVVGTRYGYSDAMWDHKAFNYFEKTGVLAIPFADWAPSYDYWGSFVSQLKLFKVDAAGGITSLGSVDHADMYRQANFQHWYWWYMPYVRRSVQIEGYVYSFSYAGMKVNKVADLSLTKAVPLPVETN